MSLLYKFGVAVVIIGFIYLWNRFVIRTMIKLLIGFHRKYNSSNLERQPIRFFVNNEDQIVRFFEGFFWIGGAVAVFGFFQNG